MLIANSAKCEVCAVIICFLHAKEETAVEIHWKLVSVYSENVMNKQNVAKWCEFLGGYDVHDKIRSGQLSIIMMKLSKTLKKCLTLKKTGI